jgi:hypothetical protein
MAFWISNPDSDPLLRRGEVLGRYGSCIPFVALGVLAIISATYHTATNHYFDRGVVQAIVLGFVALGQLMVWAGMEYLRRAAGWANEILFFLWVGAFFTSGTLAYAQIFPFTVIPWIPPILATIAKWRLARRKRVEEGTAA